MSMSEIMRDYAVERLVFLPASDLVPRDSFHAWPFDWTSTEQCGRGDTVEAAINDMVARNQRKAA